MKIILFGATGMLGNYIRKVLSDYSLVFISRKDFDIQNDSWSILSDKLFALSNDDIIINCTGVKDTRDIKNLFRINSIFPHKLQAISQLVGCSLIHISSNAVSNNPNDTYGISKLLGEPECCVIRTSIIGEELFNFNNLLEYIRSKTDITGFTNYAWNGVTCLTLARIIKKIIDEQSIWKGVRNIFSPNVVSKYQLCNYIKEVYHLEKLNIKEGFAKDDYIYPTLESIYPTLFDIPDLKSQIIEQKQFSLYDVGPYNCIITCRFCNNKLTDVIDFGKVPLAGGFLKEKIDVVNEKLYPQTFSFCNNCKTGFIKETINSENLFTNINGQGYFYYSSTIASLNQHFTSLANLIQTTYPNSKNIFEIGCNDGVLLNKLVNFSKATLIGIDPSTTINNITNDKIIKYNTFFSREVCDDILSKYGTQDLIIACNCLAHMDNIEEIYEAIKRLLSKNGTVIIEVHYIKNIVDKLNFDFIYHEHHIYYSISSFLQICKKYNFYFSKVELIDTHDGSLRIFLNHRTPTSIDPEKLCDERVLGLLEKEKELNVLVLPNLLESWRNQLIGEIKKVKKDNEKLIGYGASGRTNTILNYLLRDTNIRFDYILDDSPYKIGSYLPYFHTQIIDSKELSNLQVKTVFILAHPYTSYIIKKHSKFLENGGIFIKVLPTIEKIVKIYP